MKKDNKNLCTCGICGVKIDDPVWIEFDTKEKVIKMPVCEDCTIKLLDDLKK